MRKASNSLLRRGHHLCRRNGYQLRHYSAQSPPVQITTLSNNVRVATESTPGHFSSVGLYIDAGSRYETPLTSGISHFLDRMAFKVLQCLLPLLSLTMLMV